MIRYAPLFGLGAYCLFGAVLLFQMTNAPYPPIRYIQYDEYFLRQNPLSEKLVFHQTSKNALVIVKSPSVAHAIFSKGIKVVGDHPESKILIRIQTGQPTVFTGKLKGTGGAFPNIEARGKVIIVNANGVLVRPATVFDLGSPQQSSTLDPKPSESRTTPAAVIITGSPDFLLPEHSHATVDADEVELLSKGKVYALAIRKPDNGRAKGATVGTPALGSGTQDGAAPSAAEKK